jgi:hypothetical protein
MKKLPDVVISYYPLENKKYEYKIYVGEDKLTLLYVYSDEKEDEEAIRDWTILWWDSINKPQKKKILN